MTRPPSNDVAVVKPAPDATETQVEPIAPPKKLIDVDWDRTEPKTDAEALALWAKIAPTGADWEAKVDEIPSEKAAARPLAIALLRGGNFQCSAVARTCGIAIDVEAPKPDATFADPCLRRMLALWAIDQLEDEDLPATRDALRAIIALPLPESQLVAAAMAQFPEANQNERLEIMAIAWAAGHSDLVAGAIGTLDEAHQILAATKFHMDPAVEVLSPKAHRKVYMQAILDDKLTPKRRASALVDLAMAEDTIPPDAMKVIVSATSTRECSVAATAARVLRNHGNTAYVPKRTAAMRTEAQLVRGICVLASYQELQDNDEPSLFPSYIAKDGLERVDVAYDPLGESNADGDNDPHTDRQVTRVARDEAILPEIADLVRAMRTCQGNTCSTDDHEFKLTWKSVGGTLVLAKLEVWERAPCPTGPTPAQP